MLFLVNSILYESTLLDSIISYFNYSIVLSYVFYIIVIDFGK